jgi:hypothetical protein
MRWAIAFGRFWYDFVVGDSIILAIGGPAALASGYLVVSSANGLVEVALPLVVMLTLLASLAWRSR